MVEGSIRCISDGHWQNFARITCTRKHFCYRYHRKGLLARENALPAIANQHYHKLVASKFISAISISNAADYKRKRGLASSRPSFAEGRGVSCYNINEIARLGPFFFYSLITHPAASHPTFYVEGAQQGSTLEFFPSAPTTGGKEHFSALSKT